MQATLKKLIIIDFFFKAWKLNFPKCLNWKLNECLSWLYQMLHNKHIQRKFYVDKYISQVTNFKYWNIFKACLNSATHRQRDILSLRTISSGWFLPGMQEWHGDTMCVSEEIPSWALLTRLASWLDSGRTLVFPHCSQCNLPLLA